MSLWMTIRRLITEGLVRDTTRQVEDFRARRQAERQLDHLRRRIVQIEAEHLEDRHEPQDRGHPCS